MDTLTPKVRQTLESLQAELEAKQAAEDQKVLQEIEEGNNALNSVSGVLGDWAKPIDRTLDAIGAGGMKAIFETGDFLFGEPNEGDKTETRRRIEAQDRALKRKSVGYGLSSGISQIVVGLIGAGKVLAPIKGLQQSRSGRAAFEVARGGLASSVVLDPHEERLSDLIEEFPDLRNPVTDFLASDLADTEAEGRLKNALESIGVDFALIGALKAIRYFRAGDTDAAAREIAALERNRAEFGLDFGDGAQAGVPKDMAAGAGPTAANREAFGMDFPVGVADDMPAAPQAAPLEAPSAAPARSATPEATAPGGAPEPAPRDVIREQVGSQPPPVDPKTGEPMMPTQRVAPDEVRTQDIADKQLNDIMVGARADAEAIAKYGSKQAARDAGHQFSRGTRLPWQKLRTTTESRSLLERTADVLRDRYNRIKGGAVLKDQRVRLLVDDIAELYGHDPAHVLGQISEAGSDASRMVANMESSFLIGNRMFNDVDELAARIRNGNIPEFGGNVALAMEEFKARLAVALDTLAAGNSMLANSGRALRRARTQFRIKPGDLAKLGQMDPEKVVIIMEKAGGDPRKVSMLLNETWADRVMNQATFHLTNGLLWMWPTHLVNTTGNALMAFARPTEKLFGSAALRLMTKDPGKAAELSTIARQSMKEYLYTVTSLADGWHNAVEAFRRGDSILNPHQTEFFDVGLTTEAMPWRPVQGINDIAYNTWASASYRNIVGLPTRFLGAADEFFKVMRYRAVIQARASVEASDRGLTGMDAQRYIREALERAIDPATGRATDANVIREAQSVTFQQDLNYETTIGGSFGKSIQSARKSSPALSIILPFVKTPVNVIRYGIKLTPGINMAQKEFRDAILGKAGAEAQAHAMGQMGMASMFGGLAAHLALTGQITGAGPDDYRLKQELLSTGWKPYAVRWQDEQGNTKYFTLGRFDPFGMAFGMVADIVENMQKNPDADYSAHMTAVAVAIAKNLGEKTFLLNLNSAMEAFLDPERQLGKWLGRTAGSMLPGSSLMRGMNPDPYLREARTFVDGLIRGVPGLSTTLPLSMDVFGQPIERFVGVVDTQAGDDIVEAEHNRIMLQTDRGIGKPAPQFEGVDLRDITLSDGKNAYQRLQELSGQLPGVPSLKEELAKLIQTDVYQDLPDGDSQVKGTRLNALGVVVGKYREKARKVLLSEYPELRELVGQRQREAAGAFLENRSSRAGDPGARELLEVLQNNR